MILETLKVFLKLVQFEFTFQIKHLNQFEVQKDIFKVDYYNPQKNPRKP